jgi:lambda family phage portal protein
MKLSRLDKFIAWVSPKRGIRRIAQLRAYEAAKSYATSDWSNARKTSANAEIGPALVELQKKSRDLARNNPYSVRALNVIVNNTVGAGILANIKGRNDRQTKKLNELWKQVAESPLCDVEGRHNFYSLQAQAMRSLVESGEVIALKSISSEAPQIKLIESDQIDSTKDKPPFRQGVKTDANGKRLSYQILKNHPGDSSNTGSDSVEVSADRIAHVYRQERPGQLRGVPWSHAVIETLKDFADFQTATLIGRKIAACHVAFIETSQSDSLLNAADQKAKREAEMQMIPGQVRYGNIGEKITFNNPPGVSGYSEFARESMRAVAAGYGISYEAFTGDYSQVNFSSGRMGHIEFRRNIESWRWNLLIPQFCDPYFKLFLEWANLLGHDVKDATCEWVPPAHVMIDPTKEVAAEKEAVLAGFKSRSQVIREAGNDPGSVRDEIKLERTADKLAGLKFDTDITSITPANSAEGNPDNEEETT